MPVFAAEVDWLRPPDGQIIGAITAVAVDARDTIWILHRPMSVAEADRHRAAPPVLQFDRAGRFLRGFGGPGAGYDWPTVEHSLAVDGRGHVWISGSFRANPARADDMLLEFGRDGKFVRQIGGRGSSAGNADTRNVHAAADIFVDDRTREVYVADGYGNRRVVVYDRDSGAFKRLWGAFGRPPPSTPAPDPRPLGAPFVPDQGDGPDDFNGVHGIHLSRDGLVYVSDRNNQRIQVFTRGGRYLKQVFVDRNAPSAQTASGIALSPDPRQQYLYVADWGNSRLLVYARESLTLLGSIGRKGSAPGEFDGPHLIATDSRGTVYVAEVQGRRLQRLRPAASDTVRR